MLGNISAGSRGGTNRTGEGRATPVRGAWYLSGRMGPEEPVHSVSVSVSPFLVGRRRDAALCLPCHAVSNTHAELVDMGSVLLLRDLKSTNGSFVNGQRVQNEVELSSHDLIQFGSIVFRVLRQEPVSNIGTVCQEVLDEALSLVQFERLMDEGGILPHYQVIETCPDRNLLGFEVLARSRLVGLQTAGSMFSAASQLDLEVQLSRAVRQCAVQQTKALAEPPHLFLNTHPLELRTPGLAESMRSLRESAGSQPITLEIHEKAITELRAMVELRAVLRDLDIQLAFDDFGVGLSRLDQLPLVHPDYLKFDISLIRLIHRASREHQQMVATLVRMVREMGMTALAEGVETKEEYEVCVQLGFDLAQGYLLGRPAPYGHIFSQMDDDAV